MNSKEVHIALPELVEGCVRKDPKAQMELYRNYSTMAYQTAYRVLKQVATAEDVMQDSFLVAFDKIHQLKDPQGFGGWLKQIVHRKSLNEVRKSSKTVTLPALEERLVGTAEAEEDFDSMENLQKAFQQLKPEAQTILRLFYFNGLPHEEIAVQLEISPGASRTRLSRAKETLKNYLK